MTNPTPNKFNFKKIKPLYIICAVVSLLLVVGLTVLFFNLGRGSASKASAQTDGNSNQQSLPIAMREQNEELRGAWIASVNNINFPSQKGLSQDRLKSELDSILKDASDMGLNALFFQVRPCADSLYKSDIFPYSGFVSGVQGKGDFDCLAYLLEHSETYGIEIHAWVNPYRVSMSDEDIKTLSASSPAKLHPEYTIRYADGKTYFDPGLPEVRKLVVDGVKELVTKYPELAGIHYDDYFYPYPVNGEEFDDTKTYEKYSNGESLADWRRNNVNTLIKETYDAIKAIDKDCRFGVSPFGIWANSTSDTPTPGSQTNGLEAYHSLYCDALAWARGGYIDYLAPQNYWSFNTSAAPFDNVARWWNANLDGTGVDLYMGHAVYKAQSYSKGEIAMQVEFCRSLLTYKGSIFYGFENLKNNDGDTRTRLSALYKQRTSYTQSPVSTGQAPKINYPEKNSSAYATTYVIGSSDPAFPLKLNGKPVSRTKDGYFSDYISTAGLKELTMTQNGVDYAHPINTPAGKNSPYTYKTMDSFEIGATYPSDDTWLNTGDKLTLGCAAPAGCVVTAKIGGMEVVLSPTINPPNQGAIMYEYYTGSITPSTFAKDGEVVPLGVLTFTAKKGSQSAKKEVCTISQAGKDAYYYVEIAEDYTHTKVGTTSSFYDDFLPSSKGMRDYVTTLTDGFYKLKFGGYVASEKVTLNYGRKLNENKLLTAAVRVNSTDFTNNDNNTTDIRIGITENIPVDVDFRDGYMRILIYNTDISYIPEFDIAKNPMIESISGEPHSTRPDALIYKVKLKDDKNFYGFNIVYENGMLIIKLNNPQKLSDSQDKPLEGKVIVVDPGHGGSDIGAPGPGNIPESVLNYEIASRLSQKLRDLGAQVIETRSENQTSDLYERMDKLNAICPDLAVSVHHNSIAGNVNANKTRGFLALYSNNSGRLLAETVSKTVCTELNRLERAPSYQSLAVARNHRFPSALFEMSFISNIEEYQWTISEGGYERSALALADGILDYYRAQEAYLEY